MARWVVDRPRAGFQCPDYPATRGVYAVALDQEFDPSRFRFLVGTGERGDMSGGYAMTTNRAEITFLRERLGCRVQ